VAVTVNINGLSCVHQMSGGIATATLPDVCKTPPNSAAIPYPNIALASDLVGGTTTITVDGAPAALQSSMFVKSTGDEAGALGGVVSQVFAMEATFLSFSPTVSFEGQPVCRLTDKMLMNKGNTVCMSGVVQAPLPAMSEAPPGTIDLLTPDEPLFCPVYALFLSCGHAERDLMVNLIERDLPLLQVISKTHEHDKLLVSVDSHCGFGHRHCPSLMVERPGGEWKALDASGELDLHPPLGLPFDPEDWARAFIALMIDRNVVRQSYLLWPMVCNGATDRASVPVGGSTRIEVFPEVAFGGEITVGYAHPKIDEKATSLLYNRKAVWKMGGGLSAKIGTHSLEYKASLERKGTRALPLIGSLIDHVGKTAFMFDSMKRLGSDAKGEILWPNLKLASDLELTELSGKAEVGTKGTFKVALDPLIGFQFNVSLLNYLIRFAGTIAPVAGALLAEALIMVKERASSYDEKSKAVVKGSADVEIELIVKGEISGGIGVEFVEGEATTLASATKVEGSIGLQVEARMIVKAKIWKIEFAGGAKVGAAAASGEGSEPSKFGARLKPEIGRHSVRPVGELFFTGLAFYYLLYLEVAGTGLESKKPKDANEDEPEFGSALTDKSRYERKGSCILLEPWAWSPQPSASAGGGAGGW
jgi:hypothetical protein